MRSGLLGNVQALTFDLFGTTVDWRSGVVGEFQRLGTLHGLTADWERASDIWRSLYVPSMDRVRRGEIPWTNFDDLHRMSLDQVVDQVGVNGFDDAARDELTRAWRRLPAWSDVREGLARLGTRLTVATLSNGNREQQQQLVDFAGLPFKDSALS